MSKTQRSSIVTPSDRRAMVDCVLVKEMKRYEIVAKFNVHTRTVRKEVKRIQGERRIRSRGSFVSSAYASQCHSYRKGSRDYHTEEGKEAD